MNLPYKITVNWNDWHQINECLKWCIKHVDPELDAGAKWHATHRLILISFLSQMKLMRYYLL